MTQAQARQLLSMDLKSMSEKQKKLLQKAVDIVANSSLGVL